MSIFTKFFQRLLAGLKYVFTPAGQKKAEAALLKAYDLVQSVLPVIELVARLTPTRADDEIISLVKTFMVPFALPDRPMTNDEKAIALNQAAFTIVKQKVAATAGVPDSIVDLAIQSAYTAYRASQR
jgi:hypothetical protein